MVSYSKYGRQASSKEIGKMRMAVHDAERTANPSYIVKNNYDFSVTDFNKGIAVYKIAHIGLCSSNDIKKYIDWLKDNEVNFKVADFKAGLEFAKRYVSINNNIKGLEYRSDFDENEFFNEWNTVVKVGKKNGR